MKYLLIVLICIVCVIGGVIIGFEFSSSQLFSSLKPGTSSVQGTSVAADSSKALACSDIFPVSQLRTFSGKIIGVGTSTVSVSMVSGKPVTVLLTTKTQIQNEIPKTAAEYQKELAAYALSQKNKPKNASTTATLAPPPFSISPLSISQLKTGQNVTVLSNDSVIGKETVLAATLSLVNVLPAATSTAATR